MKNFDVNCPPRGLVLGYAGENIARGQAFDFSAWAEEYGAGSLQVALQRPGDAAPYPVALTVEGTVATWLPTETDLQEAGTGQLQLIYTVGAVRVKTLIVSVLIGPSLGSSGEVPAPGQAWIDQLTDLAAVTEQHAASAAESAENAGTSATGAQRSATDAENAKNASVAAAEAAAASASHYPQIVGGVWYVWSPTAGEYISTGIDAQGEDGVSPTVEITAIQGGHRVVITDAAGPHTFDVTDGVTQDLSAYRTAAEQDVIDDAQDDQIADLKSAINDLVNNQIPKGIVKGRYVNNSTKVLSNYSAWDGSDFIDITGMAEIVVFNGGSGSTIWNGFFAEKTDTTAISVFTVRAGETATLEVPDGAKYVILSHYTAQYPLLYLKSATALDLEKLREDVDAQAVKDVVTDKIINVVYSNSVSTDYLYFNPQEFVLGDLVSGHVNPYTRRVASEKIYRNNKPTHISADGTYQFYADLLNDDDTYRSSTGWKSDYIIPANQKFMLMFSPYGSDVSHVLDANLIPDYITNLHYTFEPEYTYRGERLIPQNYGFALNQLAITPNETMENTSQGIAVYGHTLAQICGDVVGVGKIVLVSLDTNQIIKSYDVSVGHGGNAFFLNEFYGNGDEYPLLCVNTNDYPNVINVFRLTDAAAVKVREYRMTNDDGYWGNVTYDNLTGLIYSIGYAANSYTDSTGNSSIIAVYDLLSSTEISAGVFQPTLVYRYSIPFIYCVQGLKYYNGKLIAISSYDYHVHDSWLYIIDPAARQICSIIKNLPTLLAQWEIQGVDVVDDEWIILGTRPRYFKMTLY